MLLPWLDRRWARWLLGVALVSITVLALMPGKDVPITTMWDKLDHWIAFFVLSLLANHAFPQHSFWRAIAPALVAYGVGIEIAQWLTPDRDADAMDVMADSIGIVAYGVVWYWQAWSAKSQAAE